MTGRRAHRLRRRRRRERRHRPQRRAALAAAVRPQALPQAHPRQAHDHGAQDLRLRSAGRSMAATPSWSRAARDFSAPGVHVAQLDRGGHCARAGACGQAGRGRGDGDRRGGGLPTGAPLGQPHLSDPRAWAAPRRHPFRASRTPGPGARRPGSPWSRVPATSTRPILSCWSGKFEAAALGLEHSLTPYNPITWVQLRAPGGCPISNKKQADFLAACDVMRALLPAGAGVGQALHNQPSDTGEAQPNALE